MSIRVTLACIVIGIASFSSPAAGADTSSGTEYHVSIYGNDSQEGTAVRPLRTISAAAQLAKPGDVVTVHEGVYREEINPPRGGLSDQERIVYQAAPGEKVVIKGSEIATGWRKVQNDTWKVVIPNTFFGKFNPYRDKIGGGWFGSNNRTHHTGAVYLNGHWLHEAAELEDVMEPVGKHPMWFGQVDETSTTILAQFKDINPNEADVEINVRQTIFYPRKIGVNYLTVRGFTMLNAATPWAPPIVEQIGLIGTNWSKGWIIENNDIRYSRCVGITLGKCDGRFHNRSNLPRPGDRPNAKSGQEHYNDIVDDALIDKDWSKENIGSHLVRNNHISHCEQAGLVGSLGPIFSTITGNVVHDIHIQRLFGGAEIAGIKLHGAIDTEISHNHIYRTTRGIWLDWMSQGTRVTRNLFHDNGSAGNATGADVFLEVNHGPLLVDHNILLSARSVSDWSQGAAFAHNLMTGRVAARYRPRLHTPYHKPHSTEKIDIASVKGGDCRYYNNIVANHDGLAIYDDTPQTPYMGGNVFLNGAKPSKYDKAPLVEADFDPKVELIEKEDGMYLQITPNKSWVEKQSRQTVTTELLGKAKAANLPYEQFDGSPYNLDTDFYNKKRNTANPYAGPFEFTTGGTKVFKVWPMTNASSVEP